MNRMPAPGVNPEKTLDLMWSRVRQRGDLPGFSKVIGAIVGAMRGEDDREFNMTRTVLSDPALTQRVLRLANSAMYSVFGQDISTVSKAVIVLGTDSIGHLALGLKLIEGLTGASANAQEARGEMERALMAGHIARQVASAATMYDSEEAVVCSMLHSLGRMMVAFYLQEMWQAIHVQVGGGAAEADAAQAVLGLPLDAIGRLVAQRWGLPAPLVNTLRDVPPGPSVEPLDHGDWLAAVSTLSTRCAAAVCATGADAQNAEATLASLSAGYASMLGLAPHQLISAVGVARANAAAEAAVALPRTVETPTGAALALPTLVAAVPAGAGKPADAAQRLARGCEGFGLDGRM